MNITTEAEGFGFFGDETSTGTGSGFVFDKHGRILTNFHVVQGAHSVRVTLFDGTQHDARVIGADPSNDVAVLVIDVPAEKLVPLSLGDSSKLLVGQKILALGNPFGLERTLTSGNHQQPRSIAQGQERPDDQGDHPDRRRDQSRQLGRAPAQFAGRR